MWLAGAKRTCENTLNYIKECKQQAMNTQELRNKVETLLPTGEAVSYENSYLKIPCLKTTLLAYVGMIEGLLNCSAKENAIAGYLNHFDFLINDYQNKSTNESKNNQ